MSNEGCYKRRNFCCRLCFEGAPYHVRHIVEACSLLPSNCQAFLYIVISGLTKRADCGVMWSRKWAYLLTGAFTCADEHTRSQVQSSDKNFVTCAERSCPSGQRDPARVKQPRTRCPNASANTGARIPPAGFQEARLNLEATAAHGGDRSPDPVTAGSQPRQ